MREEFHRIDFGETPVSAQVRARWQGKIASYEGGVLWSLEGRNSEGIGLTFDESWTRRLSPGEEEVAGLLERTFWLRNYYTENITVLESILGDQ